MDIAAHDRERRLQAPGLMEINMVFNHMHSCTLLAYMEIPYAYTVLEPLQPPKTARE
jgi:hypothetical protein